MAGAGRRLEEDCSVQLAAGRLDKVRETLWIFDGDLSEHLSVHAHIGLIQSADEATVGETVGTRCSVDTHDPETPEVALASATVTVLVLTCLLDCVYGGPDEVLTATEVALAGTK